MAARAQKRQLEILEQLRKAITDKFRHQDKIRELQTKLHVYSLTDQ